jgi:hypothetical protein
MLASGWLRQSDNTPFLAMEGKKVPKTLPPATFDVILADPPWSYYGDPGKWAAAGRHYSLMSDEAPEMGQAGASAVIPEIALDIKGSPPNTTAVGGRQPRKSNFKGKEGEYEGQARRH